MHIVFDSPHMLQSSPNIWCMIETKNLTKVYNPKRTPYTAINDVSLSLEEGKSIAMMGKSGSGKSTLMHLLAGLDSPSSGEIYIDGANLATMSNRELNIFRNHSVGFVFQAFYVMPYDTVFENVALPLRIRKCSERDITSRVTSMLEEVGLADKQHTDTIDLSGGQKQRVSIARALVTNPKVVFADEPTGNLDSETGEEIENLLFRMQREHKATVIVVTHDADLAQKCDEMIALKDGKLVDNTDL